MEKDLFDDLVQSLKEAKAIAKGQAPASRRYAVPPPDVRLVREQIGLTQSEFAHLMQVSIKTLQNCHHQHFFHFKKHVIIVCVCAFCQFIVINI